MTDLLRRLGQRLARIRYFLPAVAMAGLASLTTDPGITLGVLLLAQPLYLAGAISLLGYLLDVDFRTLAIRRGLVFLCLIVPYAAFAGLIVGTPLMRMNADASPLNALLLATGVALSIVLLWRLWPAFGLAFLWDDAYSDEDSNSWILGAAGRCLSFARHLGAERDAWFGTGLSVAIALLLSVCAAFSIAGLCGLLPSEFRIAALWIYVLAWCPLAYLWVARRSEALLLDDAQDAEVEESEPAPAIPAAIPALREFAEPAAREGALLAAAAANQIELALAMIERGADINALPPPEGRDQRTLAIIAATSPDLRLLRAAIAKGADLNRAVAGLTPLIAATRDSYQGRPDAVMTLIANGADPRGCDGHGQTPLHYAALSCDASVAAILIDAGAEPNTVNRDGATPLMLAAAAGNESLVRYLTEHGARTEVGGGQSALIAAAGASEDLPSIVKCLLRAKANPHARDKLGRTALHAAALHGHPEVTDVLLAAGTEIEATDSHGVTALMEAARAGANRVLRRLTLRKPRIDPVDSAGRSALVIACQSRHADEETLNLLLGLGADPRQASKDGRTAIDFAVASGRWHLVRLLDPDHPLPDAMVDSHAATDADAPDRLALLAAALRGERWDDAEGLLGEEPPLAVTALVDLMQSLADGLAEPGRALLAAHGLASDSIGEDGAALVVGLLRQRPLPAAATLWWLERGRVAGAGPLLMELLEASVTGLSATDLDALAVSLVDRGADLSVRDTRGRGLLHLAVARDLSALAARLIERGVDPNAVDARQRTPLFELAALPESAAVALARLLLLAGADPERAGTDGQTPLGAALAAGAVDLARWLSWHHGFRHPGRPLVAGDLPAAASAGDQQAVQRLLDLGLPVDACDAQGCSALLRASGGGHVDCAALLLSRGAAVDVAAHTGATPLSAAVSAKRDAVVALLLERGVSPDQRLPGGTTPLMLAAALGHVAIAGELVARGADPAATDEAGNNALHAACEFAFRSDDFDRARALLTALIESGVPADVGNQAGQTALLVLLGARVAPGTPVAQRRLAELLPLLIHRGVRLDAQDQRGVSALHAAAMHGQMAAIRTLLRAGIDTGLTDHLGRSAYEIALLLGLVDVASELRLGADQRAVS